MTQIDVRDPTRGASEPKRCWTFTNMGEATPDMITPMCWSFWTPLGELGARRAWYELGLIPRRKVVLPSDVNEFSMGTFYGRQALNVDRLATMMGALPGASREAVERNFLGTVRTDVPDDSAPKGRLPFILTKGPLVFAAQTARARRFYEDQLAWWRRDVLDGGQVDGRLLLTAARDRFARAIHLHGHSRFQSQAIYGAIEQLATSAGVAELLTSVYSAFGQVGETAIAEDLWLMSRDQLTEQDFLRRHGYHGSAEGNVTGVSWRMEAGPIRGVVKAMARRPDTEHPLRRAQAATQARVEAERALRAALPRHQRPLLAGLLRLAASRTRCQEQTKATFTMAIDGSRAAIAILGPELAAAGHLAAAEDAVFLTIDEHLAGPNGASAELATFRRARRDEYRRLTLPTTFVGMPVPLDAPDPVPTGSTTVSGVAGSSGVAEGRARVMVDLDDAGDLEPGEILVCRHTDPAWVAAMALADALVIDIGAPGSHGAIVARELGIPCVIGTSTGTKQIATGDLIRVDGTRGEVEILQSARS